MIFSMFGMTFSAARSAMCTCALPSLPSVSVTLWLAGVMSGLNTMTRSLHWHALERGGRRILSSMGWCHRLCAQDMEFYEERFIVYKSRRSLPSVY